jgi:signal transduction histidine kinase
MNVDLIHDTASHNHKCPDVEVYHLNQRLQCLIQVIQQLAVARDLDTIMAIVRTGARHLIGADGATFVLRDGDRCYYADEDAIAPLWKGGRFPMSACISGWVMLHQQSVVIEDIYADDRIPADAYRPTFVKSLAMVPIRTRDPIGAIGNYWATRHTPTPDELALLQTLADAAAIAMDNVQLYDEQEQRIADRTQELQHALDLEAVLRRITDKVRDSLDEQQILSHVVQTLTQELALHRCQTTLYDLTAGTATLYNDYSHGRFSQPLGDSVVMADFPEFYHQMQTSKSVQLCHIGATAYGIPIDEAMLVLACPIVDDHQVLGDIRLYRSAGDSFSGLDVRIMEQVANQCAIALRQARLHRAAQVQVQELERLNCLKDDFLSTVSHELRSPMASIRVAVQMLEAIFELVPQVPAPHGDVVLSAIHLAKITTYLRILSHECQREIQLINNLLDLNRIEAEMMTQDIQEVMLQDWIPRIATPFMEQAQQQQQTLKLHIPAPLPPLRTNVSALERIVLELLQNACKYTPPQETITVSALQYDPEPSSQPGSSPSVMITVSNSGVEIPERDRTAIFDTFYRIPQRDPWKNGGTGLGLALVKRLVRQIGGSISVTSTDNLVCFTLHLAA